MVRSNSGRIVLEVGVNIKSSLYERLSEEGLTLKEWFLKRAEDYLKSSKKPVQPSMQNLISGNDQT